MDPSPLLASAGLDHLVLRVALIAARLVPVFALVPCFGGRLVRAPLRVAIAIAIAVLLAPTIGGAVTAGWAASAGPVLVATLLLKELLVGAALGFLAALPFYAVDAAGRLTDLARAGQASRLGAPQAGEDCSPLGNLGLHLAVALFVLLGGHLMCLRAMVASYEALPVLSVPSATGRYVVARLAIDGSAAMLASAVGLASPALAATFLADLALGLINRVSRVQVDAVGVSVKAVIGVLALMLALGQVASAVAADTTAGLARVGAASRGLSR